MFDDIKHYDKIILKIVNRSYGIKALKIKVNEGEQTLS